MECNENLKLNAIKIKMECNENLKWNAMKIKMNWKLKWNEN